MKCDVCNNRADSLWASADVKGQKIMVCPTCIDEELDVNFERSNN